MDAESHYLNAIEALESGDLEHACSEIRTCVKIDPNHSDGWALYVEILLDTQGKPMEMKTAAQALAAVKHVVKLEPSRLDMWVKGGRLLADDLGMLHDAIHWWQACREHAPGEVTPLVEMATLLADLGEYELARQRLDAILKENLDISPQQYARISGLLGLVKSAALQQPRQIFKPEQKNHNGWQAIELKMNKPPVGENTLFLVLSIPILLVLFYFARGYSGQGWVPFCLTSLMILFVVLWCARTAKRLFQLINKPAFNLLRAMNFEASTGYVVIPEHMRTSVLYMYIMQRKPLAWQERMIKIIEKKQSLPKNWRLRLPDFFSHETEEEIEHDASDHLSSYEEE